ncbi:hypothetical protein Tco_1474229 [Tanacetum coccineum]
MVVQNQSQMGEGLAIPADHIHTAFIQHLLQPQKTQQPRNPKRKDTQVPQPSDHIENVADEAVHKELGDSLVPRNHGDTIAQTRFKSVSKHSNDSLLARESSTNEESLGEDASKQRRIDAIDADEEITLVSVQNVVEEMFDVNVLDGEEVFVAKQEVADNKENDEVNVVEEVVEVINTAKLIIDAAQVSAAGNVVSTAGDATTVSAATTTTDDDEPVKKKDQILLDEETALNLQAKFDEEERLAREKAEKEKEVNIALIETWDDIQAKIDANHQLAERMQAQEQEELSIEEKATLFQ